MHPIIFGQWSPDRIIVAWLLSRNEQASGFIVVEIVDTKQIETLPQQAVVVGTRGVYAATGLWREVKTLAKNYQSIIWMLRKFGRDMQQGKEILVEQT